MPGRSGPAGFALAVPKALLWAFTQAIRPQRESPAGSQESPGAFSFQQGFLHIALEPAPSLRPWASAPGATPARLITQTMDGPNQRSKLELSTLPVA